MQNTVAIHGFQITMEGLYLNNAYIPEGVDETGFYYYVNPSGDVVLGHAPIDWDHYNIPASDNLQPLVSVDFSLDVGSFECEEEGYVNDCSGDGDCCPADWIGDGFSDCEDQAYGCDLSCYDNDGGDC